MQLCHLCETDCGGREQPPIYSIGLSQFCGRCMASYDMYLRRVVDSASAEAKRYKTRVLRGDEEQDDRKHK